VPSAIVAALHAGDAQQAARLWTRDAMLIAADGQVLEGSETIAAALQSLVDNGAKLDIQINNLFVAADVAVATGRLTISVADHSHSSESVVVYKRGEDGVWRVAIDAPWGLPRS
jgi:uncharacterized protein (TIGR02246 family)